MEINNTAYGGFVVSTNVMAGRPIRYTYREKSSIPQLNGWTIYSSDDDRNYVEDSGILLYWAQRLYMKSHY